MYLEKLQKCMIEDTFAMGPFKTMVKSGEVFLTADNGDSYPYVEDNSRPRNIQMPQGTGYVLRTCV
jgi:hypothetical protein